MNEIYDKWRWWVLRLLASNVIRKFQWINWICRPNIFLLLLSSQSLSLQIFLSRRLLRTRQNLMICSMKNGLCCILRLSVHSQTAYVQHKKKRVSITNEIWLPFCVINWKTKLNFLFLYKLMNICSELDSWIMLHFIWNCDEINMENKSEKLYSATQ